MQGETTMEPCELTEFFPTDHFVECDLMRLLNLLIEASPSDFRSTKPQQIIMGAVMYLLMEMKWAKRYTDSSGHSAWIATRKGRDAIELVYAHIIFDPANDWTEDLADAVNKAEAEPKAAVNAEPKAAVEVDCN
jgi:hypothetical protein